MGFDKKVMEGITVAALAVVLTITAVTANRISTTGNIVEAIQMEKNGIAGVAVAVNEYEAEAAEAIKSTVSIEKEEVDVVAATIEELSLQIEEPTLTGEEMQWQDKLMADVKEFLNVRAQADGESKIVGKMRKGDRAQIIEKGEEWTKIKSGNVEGYVKNEYCVFGTDALLYAKKNCDTVAKALTDGLRVRREASTEAGIVTALGKGEKLVVDTDAEKIAGWVAVRVNSKTCYVSEEYVDVALDTKKAITIEEEEAARKAAAAAAAASASAKKSNSGQTTTISTAPGHALAASADEETLLAAIIQCESEGQSMDCMTAVGAVVINRVHSGHYPNTIYGVIHQRGQFGPASSGKLERRLSQGVSSRARQAAQAALAGVDPTGGAKSFALTSSGHAGVAIGPIVFY